MQKIKILGIAPYEGLRTLLEQVSAERDDIELHTILADKSEALDYIADMEEDLFDAIVSRGGTATSVRELVSVPVFDILVSYYDIFNILRLAENLNDKYCLVCYPSLAEKAGNICRVLDYDVKTYVTESSDESRFQVDLAISEGYGMILGDVSACRHASERGVANMLITTGLETVEDVFDRISESFSYYRDVQNENLILRNHITLQQELLIAYDEDEKLIYSSIDKPSSFLISETRKMIPELPEGGDVTVTKRNNKRTYIINAGRTMIRGELCFLFRVEFKENLKYSHKDSLSIVTDDEDRSRFYSLLYNSNYYKHIREDVSFLSDSPAPILISGHKSVGKEDLVRTIFRREMSNKRSLFFVDCQVLTARELDSHIDSVSSPLHENGCTFCFKHAHALDISMIRHIISYFSASDFHRRNRIIFTWETDSKSASGDEGMMELINKASCSVINAPSLKQMPGVIPKLTSLYINELNTEHSRQLFGIAPEAGTLLQTFDWPYNLDQLRRVIRKTYQLTENPYISAESVKRVLDEERKLYYSSPDASVDYAMHGTLDEISRRIVYQVYKDENYNQSKTAERLGISRTTLWRMLKNI